MNDGPVEWGTSFSPSCWCCRICSVQGWYSWYLWCFSVPFLWNLTLQLKSKSQDPLKAKDQSLSHELSLFYPRVAFLWHQGCIKVPQYQVWLHAGKSRPSIGWPRAVMLPSNAWNESRPEAVSSSIHKVRGHHTKASKVRPWIECKMDYVKINVINVTSTVHMQDCQKYIGLFNVYPIDWSSPWLPGNLFCPCSFEWECASSRKMVSSWS